MISAVDHAIPSRVVGALRTQIIHSTKSDARTHWYVLAAPPRLLFEQVIQHLRRFAPHDVIGAEWWYRSTTPDTEFPFHFDRDEAIRDAIVSPELATILYLSDAGGPTVIVEATPARRTAPTKAIAVHPRAGRFAMFPGAYLHGVLPGSASRWPRVTMLINWWRSEPKMERAPSRREYVRVSTALKPSVVSPVVLDPIEPSRLLSKAAWRDLIANQTSYR